MLISIITVARNSEDTIGDTVRSVIGQTHKDIEYIIVDGASEDGTLNVLKPYRQKIAKIVSEPDASVYDAMNKGIALAKGEVIGFLNADDIYAHERVLEKICEVFNDRNVQGCYSDLVYVDKFDLGRVVRYWKSCNYREGLFERGWQPPHPTFFLRREMFDKYGSFDISFKYAADTELTMRMLAVGAVRATYLNEVLVKMRVGGISNRNIRNIVRGNIAVYRACKKCGLRISPFFIILKIFSRAAQYLRRQEA